MRTRILALSVVVGCTPMLGGCVAGLAVGAADMAVRGVKGEPTPNRHLQPSATNDCTAYAERYGAVHVIDVEQHSASRIIVWGTVYDGKRRQSFQCNYGAKITGFKLRPITTR